VAYQKVVGLIQNAKDSVQHLDEWFEALYLLSPWVRYASQAIAMSSNPEAKSTCVGLMR